MAQKALAMAKAKHLLAHFRKEAKERQLDGQKQGGVIAGSGRPTNSFSSKVNQSYFEKQHNNIEENSPAKEHNDWRKPSGRS